MSRLCYGLAGLICLVTVIGCGSGAKITLGLDATPARLMFTGGTVTITATTRVEVRFLVVQVTSMAAGQSGTQEVPMTALSHTQWRGTVELPPNLTTTDHDYRCTVTAQVGASSVSSSRTVTVEGVQSPGGVQPPTPQF